MYLTPENICLPYDINITNTWFKKNGVTLYAQPESGDCTMCIKIVNSSKQKKDATLQIYAELKGGSRSILSEEAISLMPDEEFNNSYQITVQKEEKIGAVLIN